MWIKYFIGYIKKKNSKNVPVLSLWNPPNPLRNTPSVSCSSFHHSKHICQVEQENWWTLFSCYYRSSHEARKKRALGRRAWDCRSCDSVRLPLVTRGTLTLVVSKIQIHRHWSFERYRDIWISFHNIKFVAPFFANTFFLWSDTLVKIQQSIRHPSKAQS